MKKFLSFFALAGLLVACQPEELQTVIGDVAGASVTINVEVNDVLTGTTPTYTYSTAVSGGSHTFTQSGNAFSYSASTNEGIDAFTATVAVTYNGETKSTTVAVNDVLAGTSATYNAVVVIGTPAEDITYDYAVKSTTDASASYYLKNDAYTSHSHNGGTYYWNDTDYLLTGTVTYPTYSGAELVSSECTVAGHDSVVAAYANALATGLTEVADGGHLDITVSAHCYYTVLCTVTTSTVVYSITADGTEVGTVTVEQKSSAAAYDEVDDGTGHYTHGHGHGDGADNAGGGIVTSE